MANSINSDKRFGLFDPEDEEIKALIPVTATRVRVQNIDGQEKWRNPSKFEPGDQLILENGEPRCMFSTPGRKSKAEEFEDFLPAPTTEDAKERNEEKRNFIDQDELRLVLEENPDDDQVLVLLLKGLAEESASLAYERALSESRMKDTSQISLRRANILKTMGELSIKRKEQMTSNIIDLKSPHFFILLQHIIETFKETLEKARIDPDAIAVVMDQLITELRNDSWASQAVRKMKGDI